MAFEIASTNLVVELGIMMALLLGWEFILAEFVGGPLMIVILAIVFRRFLTSGWSTRRGSRPTRASSARWRATPRWTWRPPSGTWWQRLRSPEGFTATADYFVMDWAAIWRDIAMAC